MLYNIDRKPLWKVFLNIASNAASEGGNLRAASSGPARGRGVQAAGGGQRWTGGGGAEAKNSASSQLCAPGRPEPALCRVHYAARGEASSRAASANVFRRRFSHVALCTRRWLAVRFVRGREGGWAEGHKCGERRGGMPLPALRVPSPGFLPTGAARLAPSSAARGKQNAHDSRPADERRKGTDSASSSRRIRATVIKY